MEGDEVRRLAARIQQMGDDVRALAERTRAAEAVEWKSVSADRFRQRLATEASRVATAAVRLDAAAEALIGHATVLDQLDQRAGSHLRGPG